MNELDWTNSENHKKALLNALNERFSFSKEGMTPKNENSYDPIILSEYMDEEIASSKQGEKDE
jgi:hypothetical protein